jgi:hypothetical protein
MAFVPNPDVLFLKDQIASRQGLALSRSGSIAQLDFANGALISFTSLQFWYHNSGGSSLVFLILGVFLSWIFVEPSQPSAVLNLAPITITKTLIALFFASLLDPARKQSLTHILYRLSFKHQSRH